MRYRTSQAGFTIVELLIATVVFGIIMLVITAGVLSFTKQYYKGMNSANTQSAARAIIDDITRAVQFNAGDIQTLHDAGGKVTGYCIGSIKRYSFGPGVQMVTSVSGNSMLAPQALHGLVSDEVASCTSTTPPLTISSLPAALNPGNSSGGVIGQRPHEMLSPHMRLAKLNLTQNGDTVAIDIRVVYGDRDLLCSPHLNDCSGTTLTDVSQQDLSCRGSIGSQFCAVSELSTTVNKRVQ